MAEGDRLALEDAVGLEVVDGVLLWVGDGVRRIVRVAVCVAAVEADGVGVPEPASVAVRDALAEGLRVAVGE